MIGHRLMGASLAVHGGHRARTSTSRSGVCAVRSGRAPASGDAIWPRRAVAILSRRSLALWLLGNPNAALSDAEHALNDAREIGQAATLTYALLFAWLSQSSAEITPTATAQSDEIVALADEKGSVLWKACSVVCQGCVFALTGRASDAVQIINSEISALRSTGATLWMPFLFSCLARAYAELGQFDDARRCIAEAMTVIETTKERCWEAEVNRVAGEIALKSPERDAAKVEAYFLRALAVARSSRQNPGTARGNEHDAAVARSGQPR